MIRTPSSTLAVLLVAGSLFAGAVDASAVIASEKIRIEKLDDLPRHTYRVDMPPSDLLMDEAAFSALTEQVRQDVEGILDKYEIGDPNTLQQLFGILSNAAFLGGDETAGLDYLARSRELESKEGARLTTGLLARAWVAARHAVDAAPGTEAFAAAFRERYAAEVDRLPWETVEETLQQVNGQMQILNENLLVGLVRSQLDPAVAKSGFLSSDQAAQLLMYRNALAMVLPVREQVSAVLTERIAARTEVKEDIWAARTLTLDGTEGLDPVVVAVWDAGVDVDVFRDRLHVNRDERPDGEDNDGNGFVDDVNGIAYDLNHEKTPDLLYPLGDAAGRRGELETHIKGMMDLNASIDSPEAAALRKRISELDADDVRPFLDDLNLYSHHAHGTHVAGIALEGNPYARLLPARLTFDHRMIPSPHTVELCNAWAQELEETVAYFRDHGVRVVNMSWVVALKEFEQQLEANGIGASAEERGEMAREMYGIMRDALERAFRSAPGILFVGGAGNSDNDVEFDEFVPPALDLPNLMIVGAVDQAGEATGFTSFGRTVDVHANGFEVESYVPGGKRMAFSGTSMSSPQVANLAAKLIALDPDLTPEETASLIRDGADVRTEGDHTLRIIHPQRSYELLKRRLAEKSE